MTCRELTDFLGDYISSEMDPGQRTAFEEHLAECPDCVRYLDSYRKAVELGRGSIQGASGTVEMPEALVKAILAARDGEK